MSILFPVIGTNEWSAGSWMPTQQTHRGRTHAAIDIYASKGQAVVAPVNGTIRSVGSGNIGGHWARIEGNDGITYYFAHMQLPVEWKKGQQIRAGQQIGFVGNTGSATSTSPHLHFSMKRDGISISPVDFLRSATVVPSITVSGEVGGSSAAPWTPEGEKDKWGVGRWGGVDNWGSEPTSYQPSEPTADEATPAWFEQLEQYRNELKNMQTSPDPVKIKASRIMHGTLAGMANLVRQQGFRTPGGDGTGIDEDGVEVNTISRDERPQEGES